MIERKKHTPGQNYYQNQLNWQLSKAVPILIYCQVCFWGSSNKQYKFCPYGHGEMADIKAYGYDEIESMVDDL